MWQMPSTTITSVSSPTSHRSRDVNLLWSIQWAKLVSANHLNDSDGIVDDCKEHYDFFRFDLSVCVSMWNRWRMSFWIRNKGITKKAKLYDNFKNSAVVMCKYHTVINSNDVKFNQLIYIQQRWILLHLMFCQLLVIHLKLF